MGEGQCSESASGEKPQQQWGLRSKCRAAPSCPREPRKPASGLLLILAGTGPGFSHLLGSVQLQQVNVRCHPVCTVGVQAATRLHKGVGPLAKHLLLAWLGRVPTWAKGTFCSALGTGHSGLCPHLACQAQSCSLPNACGAQGASSLYTVTFQHDWMDPEAPVPLPHGNGVTESS